MIQEILDPVTHKPIIRAEDYHRLFEVRSAVPSATNPNEMIVEGKPISFEDRQLLYTYHSDYIGKQVSVYETISRGALDATDSTNCFMKYNHSDEVMPMARTKNHTLELNKKDDGLYIRANLANITAGRDLFELVKRGDIDKMSFAFEIDPNGGLEMTTVEDDESMTVDRKVYKISKLYDVSAVPMAAYDNTSINARSKDDVETFIRNLEGQRKAKMEEELRLARARAGVYMTR